ncbi:MAG: hypothetical protein ACPLPV_09030, partial [Methanomassiliicoccales archaeon]
MTKAHFDALFPLDKTNPANFIWILLEENGLPYDSFRAAEHLLKQQAYARIANEVHLPLLAFLKGEADTLPDTKVTPKRFLDWLGIVVEKGGAPDRNFTFKFKPDVLGELKTPLTIRGQSESMLLSVFGLDEPNSLERVLSTTPGKFTYKLAKEDVKALNEDIHALLKLTWNEFRSEISSITDTRKRNLLALSRFNIPIQLEDGTPLDNTYPKRIANWIERKIKESKEINDQRTLAFYEKAKKAIVDEQGNLKPFHEIDTMYVFGYAKDWFERRHTAEIRGTFTQQLDRLVQVFSNVGLPEPVSKRLVKQFDDIIEKLSVNLEMDADEIRRSFLVKLLHDKFDFATHWGVEEKDVIFRRVAETINGVRNDLIAGRTLEESLGYRFTKDEIDYFGFATKITDKERKSVTAQQLAEMVFLRSQYAERHIVYDFR